MDYSSPTRIAKLPGLPQVLMRSSLPARIIDVTVNNNNRQPINGASGNIGAAAATVTRTRTRSAVPLQQPVGPVAHSITSQASSNQQQPLRQQSRQQPFKLPVQPKLYKNPTQQNHQRRAISSSPKHHPQQQQPNSHSCSPPASNQHRASHNQYPSQPNHQPLNSGLDYRHHAETRHYREPPTVQQPPRRAVSSSPTLVSDPNLEEIKTQLQRLSKQVESLTKIYHQASPAPAAQPSYQPQPQPQQLPQAQPQFQPAPPLNFQQRYHQQSPLEPLPNQFYQTHQHHAYPRSASASVHGDHYHYLSDQKQRHLNSCFQTKQNCCNCHHHNEGHRQSPPTTKKRVDPEEELLADMSMASKEYFRRYNLD